MNNAQKSQVRRLVSRNFSAVDLWYPVGGLIAGLIASYIFLGIAHHHVALAVVGAVIGAVAGVRGGKGLLKSIIIGALVGGAGSFVLSFVLGLPVLSTLYHLACALAGAAIVSGALLWHRVLRNSKRSI